MGHGALPACYPAPAHPPLCLYAGSTTSPSPELQQPEPAGQAEVPAGPQTGDQWIDYLVSEMAGARDMQDARVRGASVLQHFEKFVKARSKDEVCWRNTCTMSAPCTHPALQPEGCQ